MTDKTKHPAAVALGRLTKGKTKRISEQERKRRAERMAHARKFRHRDRRDGEWAV